MPSIIQKIDKTAELLSPEDLSWIVPELIEYFNKKITNGYYKTYYNTVSKNCSGYDIAKKALLELSKETIERSLNTFLFKNKLWTEKRSIYPYISVSLEHLFINISKDIQMGNLYLAPICPACKLSGKKEYLFKVGKHWQCTECINKHEENPTRFTEVFSNHSRKGVKCPDCGRFIPVSCAVENKISCPYPDCCFFGVKKNIKYMSHPCSVSHRSMIHIDKNPNLSSKNDIPADIGMEVSELYNQNYNLIKSVIKDLLNHMFKYNSGSFLFKKTLMYKAFSNMLEKYPHDMIGYLVYLKCRTDFPLQSKIFKEYIDLVRESLPITCKIKGKEHTIVDLLDKQLGLFTGISVFTAYVGKNGIIQNLTTETYKDYGPCFIGMVLDVVDKNTGESLKDNIIDYCFSEIKTKGVSEGTFVEVKHYRILSHYEIGSMVYLQLARKKIITRIKKRNANQLSY